MLFIHHCKAQCLLALACLWLALPGHAGQRMTDEQAVALALTQDHVRQEREAELNSAQSEVLSARLWPNPELELARERGDDGPLGDQPGETSAVLSQQFELGGRRKLRIDAAELGVRTADFMAAYERARLAAEVRRAYADVVIAEQLQLAQARVASDLEKLARIAATRHREGDLSGYEHRRIAQAGAQALAQAAAAAAEAAAARARLAGWVGAAALTAEFDATTPLPPIPVSVDETLDEPRSAELDVLRARREQALAQANAERRWALPLNLGLGTKRVDEAGLDDDMMIVELTIPLPLFDRNQAARVRSAAEAERAEAQYQRALQKTRSRRAAALKEARQLSASARTLLDEAVPEAAQLTQIARASFAEGELGLVELLDAHAAEIELIQQAWALQSRALDALLELQLLSPPDHPVH